MKLVKDSALHKANVIFKKHFWKLLLIDFSMFIIFFAFAIYSRAKIKAYITVVSQYASKMAALQMALQQKSVEGLSQLNDLVSIVEPIATRMAIFTFLFVPMIVLLLWCIAQSMHYCLINRDKLVSLRHYLLLTVFTSPFFLAFLAVGNKLISILSEKMFAVFASWQFYLWLLAMVLLFYLVHTLYSFLFEKGILGSMVKALKAAVLNFHSLFPVYLAFLALQFFAFVVMLIMFVKYNAGNYTGILLTLIPLVLLLAVLGWYRVLFTLKAQEKAK